MFSLLSRGRSLQVGVVGLRLTQGRVVGLHLVHSLLILESRVRIEHNAATGLENWEICACKSLHIPEVAFKMYGLSFPALSNVNPYTIEKIGISSLSTKEKPHCRKIFRRTKMVPII